MAKKAKVKSVGRPRVGDEVVTFRLPTELYERVKNYAEKDRRGISDSIRLLLEAGLEHKAKKS